MALHYELEVLEALIKDELHPKNLLHENSVSESQFVNWTGILFQESDGIKKRIKKRTYTYTKENHRRLDIRQHQFAVIHLQNTVVDFLLPKDATGLAERPGDSAIVQLYKRVVYVLRDLLEFIKDEFPQYFDFDEKIPISKLMQLQEGLKERLSKLKKQLIKIGQDAALVDILIQTIIIRCHNETCQPLTFARWKYLKELMTALERMKTVEGFTSHYPALIVQLVYMNFNATVFKNYLVKHIHAEINAAGSLQEKIEVISFHHKEISQLRVKPGMALAPNLSSVQLDLVTWLFTEMTHLEKKQTLGIVAPVEFKEIERPVSKEDREKGIYSNLTSEELGLLLRALKEQELIRNRNMRQAAQSLATHWHSKQKENISWQHLYNSMSTVDVGTIRSLEDKLVGMVNWLRRMRGRQ